MRTHLPKLVAKIAIALALPGSAVAQNSFPTSGNVAIGTTHPQGRLDLGDGTGGSSIVWGGATGSNHYGSIGTSYSSAALSLVYGLKLDTSFDRYLYSYSNIARAGIRIGGNPSDISFFSAPASAQTVNGVFDFQANTKLIIKENGFVGLGTTAPGFALDIRGEVLAIDNGPQNYGGNVAFRNSLRHWRAGMLGAPGWDRFSIYDVTAAAERLAIDGAGNVGIGRISTADRLEVSGGIRTYKDGADSVTAQLYFANAANNRAWNWQTTANGCSALWGFDGSTWAEKMRIEASGNVGIGTTAPTHKLSVNGTIKAKEVIVETTGWSDYVFADDYRLAPLLEVEAHIKAERRLPGVPSEQQVGEEGVSVGEMQAALLAKIEELTLHMIRMERENGELADRVGRQAAEIEQLKAYNATR